MQKEPSYGKEHFWSALTWCLSGKKVHTIFPFKKYTSAYITICRITFFHFLPLEHIILFGHNQWNEIISNQMEHDPIYQIQSHVKNVHRFDQRSDQTIRYSSPNPTVGSDCRPLLNRQADSDD